MNQGKLAILCNYGSCCSHDEGSDIRAREWMLSGHINSFPFGSGKSADEFRSKVHRTNGGRVADNTASLNGATVIADEFSVAGTNLFETGVTSRQLAIGTGTLECPVNLNLDGPASQPHSRPEVLTANWSGSILEPP